MLLPRTRDSSISMVQLGTEDDREVVYGGNTISSSRQVSFFDFNPSLIGQELLQKSELFRCYIVL